MDNPFEIKYDFYVCCVATASNKQKYLNTVYACRMMSELNKIDVLF